ncbi:MAG: hypothetical protein WA705_28795 [Candidatus Ozemobacteraceae bacterium]
MSPLRLLTVVLFSLLSPLATLGLENLPSYAFLCRENGIKSVVTQIRDKRTVIPVAADFGGILLHPDLKSVFLGKQGSPSRIIRINLASQSQTEIASFPGRLQGYDVSSNGEQFVVCLSPFTHPSLSQIILVQANGKQRLITESEEFFLSGPVFSPDDQRILCFRGHFKKPGGSVFSGSDISRVDLDSGNVVPIAGGVTDLDKPVNNDKFRASSPCWLPDGRIGFIRMLGPGSNVYSAADADGKNVVDLVPERERMIVDACSDGKRVFFIEFSQPGVGGRLMVHDCSVKELGVCEGSSCLSSSAIAIEENLDSYDLVF